MLPCSLLSLVRLWLFILAYNLGNFMRRLALSKVIKRWPPTSIQTRLNKIGGRLRAFQDVCVQLAEVMVTMDLLNEML